MVGLDRRRATQAAAITKTKLTPSFRSKRHVLRADRMSGRTPNVNENSAEEIVEPADDGHDKTVCDWLRSAAARHDPRQAC